MNGLGAFVKPHAGSVALYQEAARARWGWYHVEPTSNVATWLDGAVALPEMPDNKRPMEDFARLRHPSPVLDHAEKILRAWPEAHAECRSLLNTVEAWIPEPKRVTMVAMGGSCGPGSTGFGSVMVCSMNPVGFAEGIVHEIGHWKLMALYIDMEHHNKRILLNEDDELYESGVRKDRKRPMSAVLHAHYSYLHVIECELRAREMGYDVSQMLVFQPPRMEVGLRTMQDSARWAPEAESFRDEVYAWTHDLLRRMAEPAPRPTITDDCGCWEK